MNKKAISIGDISFPKKSIELIKSIIKTRRVSYGPITRTFESQMAKLHDRKFAIFCNSGTSAMQVTIHALKSKYSWQDGDEILVPAITFVASSNVVIQNNLKPVFVDIEPDFFEIDPTKIEKKITKKTRAILPVHLFGQSADMEPILKIARKYNLKIIEDSCEAMFVKYKGKPVGSLGDIACFSTYATHLLATGVGGFIMTNNSKLAASVKSLINHGRDRIYLSIDDDDTQDKNKLFKIIDRRFSFIDIGYSYRATEFEAALGLGQLQDKDLMLIRRLKNAKYLINGLSKLSSFLQLPKIRPETEHAFMLFPLVIKDRRINRAKLIHFLEENNIETRLLMPLLSQPIYKKIFGNILSNYPVAARVDKNGFIIGCHDKLTKKDLDFIVKNFKSYFHLLNEYK